MARFNKLVEKMNLDCGELLTPDNSRQVVFCFKNHTASFPCKTEYIEQALNDANFYKEDGDYTDKDLLVLTNIVDEYSVELLTKTEGVLEKKVWFDLNDNVVNLISADAYSEELGKASDYNNPIDRFVFWCDVEFIFNDKNITGVAEFSSGLTTDTAEWKTLSLDESELDEIEEGELERILKQAEIEMVKLKVSLS